MRIRSHDTKYPGRVTSERRHSPGSLRLRLKQSRLLGRLTRYAIGSAVALATSVVVFALLLDAGVGTSADSAAAFVAGALPNWILNRRWAWQRSGDLDLAREVGAYTLISLIALAASSAGTGGADAVLRRHLEHHHDLRVILVTLAYVVVQGVLFAAKFVAYDRWVFTEGGRERAALSARRRGGRRMKGPEPALESDAPA
jgi:putative flippase GtrA